MQQTHEPQAQSTSQETKIVFHVNENDRWPFTIRSVRNFIAFGGSVTAVVVANGNAVRSFSRLEADPMRFAKIKDLHDKGVRFVVCNVALNERQISQEMIPSYVAVVPAGIVEIAHLQSDGYGYIKA